MELLKSLLPNKNLLLLESCNIDEERGSVIVLVSSIQTLVTCPVCNSPTHKIHSRYERKLADLSWANYSCSLELRVRKFFCINTECKRRIFTERLPGITMPWARRTIRLASQLTAIGLSSGGAAGVRLSQRLGLKTSRNTLLNLVRRVELPLFDSLKIIGVDDFCFRKCKTYGTIIVDLEKNRPITLLKDRSAETLSEWLKLHPGIKIVSRDRAKAYEKGINEGAPDAIQVADRFHLLQNLAQTLYEVFGIHSQDVKVVEQIQNKTSVIQSEENIAIYSANQKTQTQILQQEKAEKRRMWRLENHQQVWELRSRGWSGEAIAKKLGIGRATVFRYLRNSTFIERRGRKDKGQSLVDFYQNYIQKRWNEGCHEAKILFNEIKQQGYKGSYATVTRYMKRLLQDQGLKKIPKSSRKKIKLVSKLPIISLTPYRLTWLIMGSYDKEISESRREEIIALLKAQNTSLASAIDLGLDFISLICKRKVEDLDSWLNQAYNSILSPFHRFAKSLLEDYSAVKAALTLPWSNGPVEGQINRLKMLKRQMYGRAKIDLLNRRFLLQI
ncbi:MAG: ISL3 family transposase [Scytonematopsis contorta HA4267-MV1]|jgi:transposase|nr:ISL3 family transposase [Scytonematopsis contorta HA4267-MV1]